MKRKNRETEKILEQAFKGNVYQLDMDSIKDKYYEGLDSSNVKRYYKKWKKLSYSLMTLCVVLVIGLIGVTVYNNKWIYGKVDNEILEKLINEAEKSNMTLNSSSYIYYNVDNIDIYVYKGRSLDANKFSYYYIIQEECKSDIYLIIDGKEILVKNDSYGVLSEKFVENPENEITFFVKKDGKITEFSIKN